MFSLKGAVKGETSHRHFLRVLFSWYSIVISVESFCSNIPSGVGDGLPNITIPFEAKPYCVKMLCLNYSNVCCIKCTEILKIFLKWPYSLGDYTQC